MNSIYNNIKGVIGAICLMSMLFSGYSCSQGTDEELISKDLEYMRMNIHPYGCVFYVDDTLDNKPEMMRFLVNRVLKTWRTSLTLGFEEEAEGYKYIGDIIGDDDVNFVAGTYHAAVFTYDDIAFNYNDMKGFLYENYGLTQLGLDYNVDNSDVILKTARLFSAFLDNYNVDESLNDNYFKIEPECLTQRYVWEFYVKKTDTIARIDAVEAEIDGVPCRVDLRSKEFNASKVAKVKAFGEMTPDDFGSGRDTVRISVDVFPIVAPSHASKFNLVENNVGNLKVRMTITGKHFNEKTKQWEYKSKDWLINHRMDELDSIPVYDLLDDNVHISKKNDIPAIWKYKIQDDILVNRDTINTRRYGKWQVIK